MKWRRSLCRPCYNAAGRERNKAAYAADPEKGRERQRRYNEKKKAGYKFVPKTEEEYRQIRRDYHVKRRIALRRETFIAYGGLACACCGEKIERFLTLDHINDNGNEERRYTGVDGLTFYSWLKRNGFPPGYQVLCFNCNYGKYHNGGVCPHVDHRTEDVVTDCEHGSST